MSDRHNYYKQRISRLTINLQHVSRKLNVLSIARLIVFILAIVVVAVRDHLGTPGTLAGLMLTLILFGWFVKWHIKIKGKRQHLQQLIIIHQRETEILSYRYENQDPGKDFIDQHHPYAFDLDIFGEGSLFQFINRTFTKRGREKLAGWLALPVSDPLLISLKQDAMKELAAMDDFRQQLMATGEITADKSDDMHEVTLWMNEPAQFSNHWFYRVAYVFFPLLSAVLIVFTLINPDFYRLLVLLFLLQLMIVGLKLRTTTRIHGLLSRQLDTFKKLNRLLEHIQREEFRASHLKDLKDHFYTGGHPAQKAVRQLSKILSAFDNRLNVLAGLMLNGFLLWDVQCLVRLENWKRRYRNHFPAWVDSLAEMDALISLATFHFNHPDFCFPEFTDEVILRTTAMGHPLIAGQERVCNDFLIPSEGSVVIITGANMAGKSTFLRSVGVNMVLAMTGAPVCAEAFSFRPLALFTSMRTSDSLHHHESYFYAELKRIKSIVDELLTGKKMLIILDEILKGTNSADKHRGSVAVLNRIMALKGTGIIATHDLELAHTAVKASGQIINQCFEIEIRGAEVFFDYRLRDGITQKMNASLLMQQMGIVSQ